MDNKQQQAPSIITKAQHKISLADISTAAKEVIDTLQAANYTGYLVGGSVRDLILDKKPKDFDIATNAEPVEIRKIFKRAQIIGKRFPIIHIYSGSEITEVTTFRGGEKKDSDQHKTCKHTGIIIKDNVYGTIDQDAIRRDFTINALYYNPKDETIIDYHRGFEDLKTRTIRMIGEPKVRYCEDPMRIMRAIRLASKLDCQIEENTLSPIAAHADLLCHVSHARLIDEFLKTYRCGNAINAIKLMKELHVFEQLFPFVLDKEHQNTKTYFEQLLTLIMKSADRRVKEEKSLSASLLFSALLWPEVHALWEKNKLTQQSEALALRLATNDVLNYSMGYLTIPKRLKLMIREVWLLQYFFTKQTKRHVYHLYYHKRFKNALHLLNFRAKVEKPLKDTAKWWDTFYHCERKDHEKLMEIKP